jgi:hypothetical protein
MAVYKVLKPIILGGRIEAGETIEIPESEASAFGPEYLEKAAKKPKRKNNSLEEEQSTV